MKQVTEEQYWTSRYNEDNTGWDIGAASTPLKTYIDQLTNKELSILIPGAGRAYEAEYLYKQGFQNVYVLDISDRPLAALKQRVPEFPAKQLLQDDFFQLQGQYELILEQTFFCSFLPSKKNRQLYAAKMSELLRQDGKLVGIWFKHPLMDNGKRPFGGTRKEYLSYLESYFEVKVFEDCYNSIRPRMGNELFGIFRKKG